jgi:hypothetical protein
MSTHFGSATQVAKRQIKSICTAGPQLTYIHCHCSSPVHRSGYGGAIRNNSSGQSPCPCNLLRRRPHPGVETIGARWRGRSPPLLYYPEGRDGSLILEHTVVMEGHRTNLPTPKLFPRTFSKNSEAVLARTTTPRSKSMVQKYITSF